MSFAPVDSAALLGWLRRVTIMGESDDPEPSPTLA
jgi:hypothetical protein